MVWKLMGKCYDIHVRVKKLEKNSTCHDTELDELHEFVRESQILRPQIKQLKVKNSKSKIKDGDEFELYGVKIKANSAVPKDEIWGVSAGKFKVKKEK